MDFEGKSDHRTVIASGFTGQLELASVRNSDSELDSKTQQRNFGFLNLLRFDLVMEELLQNLSFKEMKVLSSVSKDALLAVRQTKAFSERIRFRICEGSILSHVLDNCVHYWKKVDFDGRMKDDPLVDCIPATIPESLYSIKSFSIYNLGTADHERPKLEQCVLKIMECSKESLEDLKLNIPHSGLEGIESIQCPKLKSLSLVDCKGLDDDVIKALLKNLPPLEELTVDAIIPSTLISVLQGRVSKLRKLDITIGRCNRSGSTLKANDLKVVADMRWLEELKIDLHLNPSQNSIQDVEKIITCIPVETVRKIRIDRFNNNYGYGPPCFHQKVYKDIISRFANLTELSLGHLKNFDDDSLQSIFRGCSKLKHLALIELYKLTDFGLSGVESNPNGDRTHFGLRKRGVALNDLRGLATLSIQACGPLTLATLLEVIRFEFLTSISFEGSLLGWKTPREFLLQILRQNPSLKSIYIWIESHFSDSEPRWDEPLENDMKILYLRIKKLEFAHPPEEFP